MFNWKAELELAKHRVAELEEGVARLREEPQPSTADARQATPIVERNQRILTVRMASLERANFHQRFIEQKVAMGVKAAKPLPYLELAEVCFKASSWMPQGEAAEAVRRSGATFYTKAIAQEK